VARVLATMSGLKVVTNAINIASELAVRSQIGLVVCGGSARPESHELVGPLAEQTLSRLNVDIAFVGVDGITAAAGLTTHHEVEAATNRAMIRIAARVVVVTDGSKLGRRSFAAIAGIDEIDDLITDPSADADECRRIEDADVNVVIV
jgi:DeoR family transcriptional regulator, aga operon transcriptional repressor